MKQPNDPQRLREFAARLNAALDAAGVARKGRGRRIEVARVMGVLPSGARRWLEGEAYPSLDRLPQLADRYGTTIGWLLDGRVTNSTAAVMSEYKAQPGRVPHLAWTAIPAWVKTEVASPEDVYGDLPTIKGMSLRGFAVSVPNDTMLPDFPEDGVLYMDPDIAPRSGDYVLARTDIGELTFKNSAFDFRRRPNFLASAQPRLQGAAGDGPEDLRGPASLGRDTKLSGDQQGG